MSFMRLPNGTNAFVDDVKITDYCLSDIHPRGKHKARVFRNCLGLTHAHASQLREALLIAAAMGETLEGETDEYGARYVVDFTMSGPMGTGTVRSTWIILKAEDFPRLTSCYVL